ncbi:Gfo/Idh/MocA family protein [Paenibacillus sp. YIM B09110]|uniref:Gfo/Idh/MocA family protein n=1 Tax=Paenibacillus sp. YIM B09110 TaxID=3126102 RepID=UPI00301C2394
MNIGLIGYGKWGPNIAKEITLNKDLRLTAICDIDIQRLKVAEELYSKDNRIFFDMDYRTLLTNRIDAIVVSVGMENSFGIAKDVLLANKHLFIEKPFAMTTEHAAELHRIADQRGLTIHVDHIMVFHPAITKIKNSITESNAMIAFEATRLTSARSNKSEGLLWDLAVHDLAVLDYLLNGQEIELIDVAYHSDEIALTLGCNSFIGRIKVGHNAKAKDRHTLIKFADKEIYFNELDERKIFTIYEKDINGCLSNPMKERYAEPSALSNSLSHFMDCVHRHSKSIAGPEQAIRGIRLIEKAEKLLKMEMAKK